MAASSMHTRSFLCQLHRKSNSLQKESLAVAASSKVHIPETPAPENTNIVLQPRLCNLRTYGTQRNGLLKTRGDAKSVSPFFDSLSAYIDNSRKSEFAEILSGRLAMMVFAAAVGMEMVTGNSLFRKMDVQGIIEAGGVYLAVVLCAAIFAFFSTNRKSVGKIFTLSCNTLVDSLIDNLIEGLFYENDYQDWMDDI